jgi:hypothetical protein
MKWDYLVVKFRLGKCVSLLESAKQKDFQTNWLRDSWEDTVLEAVGDCGWELVCQRTIDTVADAYVLYFKRPKK